MSELIHFEIVAICHGSLGAKAVPSGDATCYNSSHAEVTL